MLRRTISLALRDAGVDKPYPLENENGLNMKYAFVEAQERLAEFEWAFGNDAQEKTGTDCDRDCPADYSCK